LTVEEILRRRLAGQMLTGPGVGSASDVVRALGAVQAQDYGPSKWSLGMRARGIRDADVEREVGEGRILRTHILRPTWHFVAAEDLRWMLALTAPRVTQANTHPYKFLELDDAVFKKSRKVIVKALSSGEHLTRDELGAALQEAGVDIRPNRLSFLAMDAELNGVICSGTPRGKLQTYALLDERVPPAPALDRDEALGRLALRYFATRGPASAHDFAWWSGLTLADVRRATQVAGDALETVSINERPHWMIGPTRVRGRVRAVSGPTARASGATHLLPTYDELFIGLKDRSASQERLPKRVRATLGVGIAPQFVFVDGEIVARWRRSTSNGRVTVEVEPLTRVSAAEKGRIAGEAQRLADFFGLSLDLRYGPIAR
jgi:hypothetical protein